MQNIKALKLFVWERLVAKRVENARQTQLTFLLKAACLKAAMSKNKVTSHFYHAVLPQYCTKSNKKVL